MHHVYVLKSLKNGKRYVGSTGLTSQERLKEHNWGSNKFAKANKPFTLIYEEEYANVTEARKR